MAASQVNVLIQVRGCVCFFLLKCPVYTGIVSILLIFLESFIHSRNVTRSSLETTRPKEARFL